MIDLANEEHRRVLLCICDDLIESSTRDERLDRATFAMPFGALGVEIFDTLSDPAKAAELIRQLVEQQGVSVNMTSAYDEEPDAQAAIMIAVDRARLWIFTKDDAAPVAITALDIPTTIVRLLALPPDAGAEAVLAALRGEEVKGE